MPHSPMKKYESNGDKNRGTSSGIFLLFLLLLPSTAQDLSEAPDELFFICPQGPQNTKCSCTQNEVNCMEINLLAVPSDLGTNIQSLILRKNFISSIDSITSQLPPSLVYIDASFNAITFVDWSIFSALTNLEELHLQMNLIYWINLSYFHGTKLRVLNISGNHLVHVTEEILRLPLEELYIENCGLTYFGLNVSNSLCKLRILHVGGNSFSIWPVSALSCMTSLEEIKLNNLGLTYLSKDTFSHNAQLQFIDLSDNLLTTLPATIFDGLDRLQVLNLAGNPWSCDCSLLWLKVFLESFLLSGRTVVNIDRTQCITGTESNMITGLSAYPFSGCEDQPKPGREKRALVSGISPLIWPIKCTFLQSILLIPCGSSKAASCVYTFSGQKYSFVQFLGETSDIMSKTKCRDVCQENNNTYFFHDSGSTSCLCGDTVNIPNCTECSALTANSPSFCNNLYSNVGEAISVVYDLTIVISPTLPQVMLPVHFTLSGGASIYDVFFWNFGDATTRSVLNDKTASHTYIYPGQFEVTVTLTSSSNLKIIRTQVVVRLTVVSTSDGGTLICSSTVVRASARLNVSAVFTSAWNQKVRWTRKYQNLQGQGRITEYEKKCEPLWTQFRNRCIKINTSATTMAKAHLSCIAQEARLLRFYSAEEITELQSRSMIFQSSAGARYWTGAEWASSLESYTWKNTSVKAYVFREILPNATKGSCVALTSAGLQGMACNEQLPFVCEKDPVTCTGNQQSVGQTCFVVVSKPAATWDQAQNACQSTFQNGKLASIFYSSDNLYISGLLTSRAWIGLRAWTAPGYYTWQGGQALTSYTNWVSTDRVEPCVSINSSGLWQAEECGNQNSYVCEYFVGDEVKIPWLMAGFVAVMNDIASPVTSTVMTAPQIMTSSQVTLLLGSWFSTSGSILRWNIQVQSLAVDTRLSLQIWRPFCGTGNLVSPGCSNNRSPLFTCSNTPSLCSAYSACLDGQYLCMLTNTCLPITKPCTCASITSISNIDCQNLIIDSMTSKLRLVYFTTIMVAARTTQINFESMTKVMVQAGDIIGFQSESDDIGVCEEPSTSQWRHPVITASTDYWMDVGDIVDPKAYQLKKDVLCRINAVYTTMSVLLSPVALSYVTSAGIYNYTLVTNSLNIQTCSVTAMDDVRGLLWVYPEASTQVSSGQGYPILNVIVEAGLPHSLTLKVLQGSNPTATWVLNNGSGITTTFSADCPTLITSLPDRCSFHSSLLEAPYSSLSQVFPSGSSLTNVVVNVTNDISWEALHINIYAYVPITVVEFYHDDCVNHTACEVIVETEKTQTFHMVVKDGDMSMALFYEDGKIINPVPSDASVLPRTFQKSTVYILLVNVSNPLSWKTVNLTVHAKVRAKFYNMSFVKVVDKVAAGTSGTVSAVVRATIGAHIVVVWSFNGERFQYSMQVNTTILNISYTYRFNTTGNVSVVLLLSDTFGDNISSSLTVEVYKTIDVPLVLSTSDKYVVTLQDFNLTIRVENCSLSDMDDYGELTFTVDWNDGSQVMTWRNPIMVQILQHKYKIVGVFTIVVTVLSPFNTSNIQTGNVTIEVQDVITGLSLSYDGPNHFSKNITFTAAKQTGSNVMYSIDFGDNFTKTSFQTSPVFVFQYSVAGVYRANITAKNAVSERSFKLILYAYDENLLEIIRINAKPYVALRKIVDISADVAAESPDKLFYEWNFGNSQMSSGHPLKNTDTTYDFIGIYTITLKVQKNISSSSSNTLKKEICVQELISGLSVSFLTPIALRQPGASEVAIFNASVIEGSNLIYTWTVNGGKDLPHQDTLNLTITEAKVFIVTVKAENNLNNEVQTVELTAIEVITKLQVRCQSCFLLVYARTNKNTTLEASVLYGTIVNYTWTFDDSSTYETGKLVQHNFTAPRAYTVKLLAENAVSNESLAVSIIAQDEVTGVSIKTNPTIVEVNVNVTFQVTFSSGTNVNIQWKCDSSNMISSNSTSLAKTFQSAGYHQCSVVITNAVSSVAKSSQVAVLDQITVLAINHSLRAQPGSINLFAAVGFEYTFIAHINTNFLVDVEWRAQNVVASFTFIVGATFKFTFKSRGIYQIAIKAQNSVSFKNTSIIVEAQEQIHNVYIGSNKTSPLQVFTGEAISFHVVVGTGSHLTYLWTLGGLTLPSRNDSVIIPFNSAGNFTVKVAISNDLDTVTAMVQVYVYTMVSHVSIRIKQSLSLPYVMSNTTLDLYSLNVSGAALVYIWTITHVPSGRQSTSDQRNISFFFNLTGTYQVFLKVQNPLSSEEDLLTLVVQGAVTELKVTLQDSVVATGSNLTFTAEANPDATDVSYKWQIDGEIKQVPSFVKLFSKAGVYKVFITAANNVSSVSKENLVIRVLDAIPSLQIKDCQLVRVAQVLTSLQAIVDSGTNITFTWNIEVDNQNKTFTGQSVHINFQTEGTYSAILTAHNDISTKTTSCHLQVQFVISHVTLAVSNPSHNYIFQNQNVTFTATGNNLGSAIFVWKIANYSTIISKSNTYITSIPTPGNYTLTLIVSNGVSQVEVVLNFTVKAFLCHLPDVFRVGAISRVVQRSRPLELEVAINAKFCTAYIAVHKWAVFRDSNCKEDEDSGKKVDIGDTATSSPSIIISPRVLDVGVYCIHFATGYEYTSVSLSVFYLVNVTASKLKAIIKGGNERTIAIGTELQFDGTLSFDPDDSSKSHLTYNWKCVEVNATGGCFTLSKNSTFYHNGFNAGQYRVTLLVDSPGRAANTTEQIINVLNVSDFVPIASVVCESCLALGSFRVSSSQHVVLSAACDNCQCEPEFMWKIFEDKKEIPISSSQTSTGLFSPNLVLNRWGILKDGFPYTFLVQVSCVNSKSTFGTASLTLPPNLPPSNGRCFIHPTADIIPLIDKVFVNCSGWINEDDHDKLIFYKIFVKSQDPLTGQNQTYVLYSGSDEAPSVYVSSFTGTPITLCVMVGDEFGAFALGNQSVISFKKFTHGNMTKTDYLVEQTENVLSGLIKQASPISLLQYAIALGQQLNAESQKEEEAQTSGKGTRLEQTRAAVRDAVTICLSTAVPILTLEDVQQMALALRLLTDFVNEYLTEDSQKLLATTLQVMDKVLQQKVSKGLAIQDVPLNDLLSVNINLISAANARINSVMSLWESGRTITIDNFNTNFRDLRPEIAVIVGALKFTDINLNETHRKLILSTTVPLLEHFLVSSLQTMSLGEASLVRNFRGIKIKATRSYAKYIELRYFSEKTQISIPSTILSGKKDALDEVFQVMISHDRNPYTYGYSIAAWTQMPVQTISFYETNGSYIQVADLADNARVGLHMFSSLVNANNYKDTVNDSCDVDAVMNLNYKRVTLAPNKSIRWQVPVLSSEDVSGVGVHVQLRFSNLSMKMNSTNITITAYLGINFIPSSKHYKQLLTLTPDLMKNGVDHRKYTFFLNSLNPSDEVHIVATNDDNQSEVELSVGVYYSSCEYFDTVNQIWAHNGCQAQEESTAVITSCQCNHLTSFGGTGIVSITDIDFADLDNLDILTNPVVFIAVAIIFVIYILAALLSHYLDRLDLKRISKIPLCGQVGSFLYEVTMVTGCHYNAGTSAHVGIKLYGSSAKGEARHLTKPAAFQRNCRDTFLVAHNTNLGEITKVLVWHDNTGLSPSWFLSHILVKDLQTKSTFVFLVNSWLSLDNNDGVIQKTVKAADEKELKKFYSQLRNVFRGLMSDVHTWMSVSNKPDHSRFTRVQRCICCLTFVYLYMSINAMWYGFFKDRAEVNAPLARNFFGWEEVVMGLVSTVIVVPFIFGLTLIFKKSRCKTSMFQEAQRPGSAQTLEIDVLCTISADGGSYRTATPLGDWIPNLDRESTTDSISQVPFGLKRTVPMHRSKRKESSDSAISVKERPPISGTTTQKHFWNKESILKSWPNELPHWPSKTKFSLEHGSAGPSGDSGSALAKQNSRSIRNFHGNKSLQDSDEDILQQIDEADAVIARDEEKRKKKLARKARQAGSDGLFDSDDEWVNEGLDDVVAKDGAASFNPRKEAELIPNLGRKLSHTNFTLPDDSTRKPDSAGGSKKDRKSSLLQDGARPSIVSTSSKSKTILSGRLRSLSVVSQMSEQNNSGCVLPFWCVYVAYTVCAILCLLSVILVLLYGYNFGVDVAIKWVVSLCFTLFISILIVEPLKVLVLTVYKTAYSGDTGDENCDMIDIKPQVELNEQLKDVKFRPLGGFALLQAKEEGKKKQRLHIMMREVLVFTFMFGLFLAIVYTNYNSDSMYHTTNNIHSKLYSGVYSDKSGVRNQHHQNVTNLRSIPDFWQWTQTVLARSLHYRQLFPTENFGYLMGPAWLRQIRGKIVTCPAALKTASLSVPELVTRRCVDSGESDPDTVSYAVGWTLGSTNWTYFSSSQLNRFAKFGQSLLYLGGGYIQKLGLTYQETTATLQQLESDAWVDLQTRAVFVEFTLYSPSKDLTSCVTIVLEFPTTGGILASSTVWTERLLRFIPGRVDPIMVCQIIFLPFILYVTIMVYNALRSQKLIFFTNFWNWLDLLICILMWTNFGLYITCVVLATSEVKAYLAEQTAPNQLEKAAMLHSVLREVHACLMLLFILKIVRQVRFFKPLYKFYNTLATASTPLFGIFFIFTILLLTYAQFGYLLYGSAVYGYHNFHHCLMSLCGIMGSHTNFWPMFESRCVITHLFFISFGIFVYGMVVALSVAVLTWSFRWSRTQITYKTSLEARDYEMIDFMIKRFKLLTGMRKQKPLFRHVKFEGLPSLPSRNTSSNISRRSCISPAPTFSGSAPVDTVQEYLEHCMTNLQPAWDQVMKTVQKIEELDSQDEVKLRDLLCQIMKPSPIDSKLKPPNASPVPRKPVLCPTSSITKLMLHDGGKDVTSLPSHSRMTPQTFTIFESPRDTSIRMPTSSQKARCDPKLNNDGLQTKKRMFQFSHQVKPAHQSISSSTEQRSNIAYGFSASSNGSNISDKRSAFEHGISGLDGNPNKRKRVWRSFSPDPEV